MSHNKPNVLGVAVIAGAVGAIAGLLFAPKKGDETRAELRAKYADMKQKSVDTAEKGRQKAHEGVEAARDKVHELTDKGRTGLSDVADKVDASTDKAANKAHAKADEAAAKTRPRNY